MGGLPNVFPGYQAVTSPEIRSKIAQTWGVDELPSEVGLTLVEMINAADEGQIKAMYIVGENPMVSDPDTNHVRKSLENLELMVIQDIFLTETARLADVVLPTCSFAEKEGTFTNTERRVQLIRKAVEPPGEARTDWEIICRLADLMGAGKLFPYASAEEIFEEIRRVTPQYAGMTYARLNQPDGLQWPCPDENHPGTLILHTKQFSRGKGKFHAVAYRPPAEEVDAEYPYILTTNRVESQYHTGTMTRRSPTLEAEFPESFIEISFEDAEKLGIKEGDMVKVASRRGEITVKALVTDRIKSGVVCIPFHFAEGSANVLTNSALDPQGKIPELKVCAVKIEAQGQ